MVTQKRDNGRVIMMRRTENRVRRWAQIPGPSSHAEKVIIRQTDFYISNLGNYLNLKRVFYLK